MAEMTSSGVVDVVLGTQWGDEGKGKLIDVLAEEADVCCRCAGGDNAGHTVIFGGKKYVFHLLPSGILRAKCILVIGNGVVVNLESLFNEIDSLKVLGIEVEGRLYISDRAHVVFGYHIEEDKLREKALGKNEIGTTKRGIGPAYAHKVRRAGIRMQDVVKGTYHQEFIDACKELKKIFPDSEYDMDSEINKYDTYAERLKPLVVNTTELIHNKVSEGSRVIVEGANGTMLDIDLGTYPFVTSSCTSIGGVISGLGIPPQMISKIYGVSKAYTTRVGAGPFVTELNDQYGDMLQSIGSEFGATTGRPRRCGWLDLVALKHACMINGITHLCITKVDVLAKMPIIKVAIAYKLKDGSITSTIPPDTNTLLNCEPVYIDFKPWSSLLSSYSSAQPIPELLSHFLAKIDEYLAPITKITLLSYGPDRDKLVKLPIS